MEPLNIRVVLVGQEIHIDQRYIDYRVAAGHVVMLERGSRTAIYSDNGTIARILDRLPAVECGKYGFCGARSFVCEIDLAAQSVFQTLFRNGARPIEYLFCGSNPSDQLRLNF